MELNFKPGKFALNRDTLETVIVKEVDGDRILVVHVSGEAEMWTDKKDYNLFKRKDGKWIIEGPPIYRSNQEVNNMQRANDRTNISERFK
jgi:hypothetical protein